MPLSTINLRCSAVLMTLQLFGCDLTGSVTLRRLRTALHRLQPPVPRYSEFFDVVPLLRLLQSWGSSEALSLKSLRARAIVLLRIDSFARSGDLVGLWRSQVEFLELGCRVRFYKPKELRVQVGTRDLFSAWVHIGCVPELPQICAPCNLRAYALRTAGKVSTSPDCPFFLPLRGRPVSLSSDTFSNEVQHILTAGGVDPKFHPHALRGCSLSAALSAGCPLELGRRQGRWAVDSPSFEKHYDRAVEIRRPPFVVFSPYQIARLLRLQLLADLVVQ